MSTEATVIKGAFPQNFNIVSWDAYQPQKGESSHPLCFVLFEGPGETAHLAELGSHFIADV